MIKFKLEDDEVKLFQDFVNKGQKNESKISKCSNLSKKEMIFNF